VRGDFPPEEFIIKHKQNVDAEALSDKFIRDVDGAARDESEARLTIRFGRD
jgi:hypothetical protein